MAGATEKTTGQLSVERRLRIAEQIREFSRQCEEAEYTDTGTAWELLTWILKEVTCDKCEDHSKD